MIFMSRILIFILYCVSVYLIVGRGFIKFIDSPVFIVVLICLWVLMTLLSINVAFGEYDLLFAELDSFLGLA